MRSQPKSNEIESKKSFASSRVKNPKAMKKVPQSKLEVTSGKTSKSSMKGVFEVRAINNFFFKTDKLGFLVQF